MVGLTGGIGSGKSTVAALLARAGATIVDCDGLGRLVVEPGGSAHQAVIDAFGPTIVDGDGRIDRAVLAAIVFADDQALDRLNRLTHPAINAEIARRIAAAETPLVVLDMAVLVETDLGRGLYDLVVVVEAPRPQRVARLVEDRGMDPADVEARMAAQATDEQRRAVADHVVVNDGDLDALTASVSALLEQLAAGL